MAKVKAADMLPVVESLNIADVEVKSDGSHSATTEKWQLVVLFGIYQELKRLNTLLHCSNFVGIPGTLRAIRKNTAKPKRKKKVKP